jgi:hypothetical protein
VLYILVYGSILVVGVVYLLIAVVVCTVLRSADPNRNSLYNGVVSPRPTPIGKNDLELHPSP